MTVFPKTVMLLGSGELGKEVVIAAQRLGCRVIACDRYAGAPAMQVADQAEVFPMTDAPCCKRPSAPQADAVIPEIEPGWMLCKLEDDGIQVIPRREPRRSPQPRPRPGRR